MNKLDKQVNIHSHTHYSNTGGFKDSVIKPGDAMKYVASLGQKAISFSEHDTSIAAAAAMENKSFFMIRPPILDGFSFFIIRRIQTECVIVHAGGKAVFY